MSDLNKVLTATDKTSKAVLAANAALVANITIAQETLPALLTEIENKQSELLVIDQEIADKSRRAKVELGIKVSENEEAVLKGLLDKRKLAMVTTTDLATLQEELSKAQASDKSAIDTAVAIAVAGVKRDAEMAALVIKSAHEVATAKSTADIEALQTKVQHLESSLDAARADLTAERAARITIAQADAGREGVTVNTGNVR